MSTTAVFLDRDGTLIREVGYLSDPAEIEVLPTAFEAVRRLRAAGQRPVIITNQSGIARGFLTEADLERIHERLRELFRAEGAELDAIYACPHHPEGVRPELSVACECRKPAPGLLERAGEALGVELSGSLMVGDKLIDVEAGRRAGTRVALVRTGYGEQSERLLASENGARRPDFIGDTVLDAVEWFLERTR